MKKTNDVLDLKIGRSLKKLRMATDMSLQDVADKCNTSKSTIFYYETGRTSVSVSQLIKLCDIYNTNYIDFLKSIDAK